MVDTDVYIQYSYLNFKVYFFKYYVSGRYPPFFFLSKTSFCLYFKTQRFGDWILSPSLSETYSVGPNR
jgi:hypothetical protein